MDRECDFVVEADSEAADTALPGLDPVVDRIADMTPVPSHVAGAVSVATYNIHRCIGLDRIRDPARIATVIGELGADVIVIADAAAGNAEHTGEAGLGLLRTLTRAGSRAPIVCAGAAQADVLQLVVGHLLQMPLVAPLAAVFGQAPPKCGDRAGQALQG